MAAALTAMAGVAPTAAVAMLRAWMQRVARRVACERIMVP